MEINYLTGDATQPIGKGNKVIAHISNSKGAWASGFVMAISERWSAPEKAYRSLEKHPLGLTQFVPVEWNCDFGDIVVANMIAQTLGWSDGKPPIRYQALTHCLMQVNDYAVLYDCTVHMPRIGTMRAGGDWKIIEEIIKRVMTVDVYVYTLPIVY